MGWEAGLVGVGPGRCAQLDTGLGGALSDPWDRLGEVGGRWFRTWARVHERDTVGRDAEEVSSFEDAWWTAKDSWIGMVTERGRSLRILWG